MKFKSNKDNVLNEVFNFFTHNYDKYVKVIDERDTYSRFIRFEYDMFGIKLKIEYICNSSQELTNIKILANNVEIHKYVVDEIWFDKKYRFFKKFLKYFDKKENDKRYTDIYEKIKNNKPLNIKRSDKIKNILK